MIKDKLIGDASCACYPYGLNTAPQIVESVSWHKLRTRKQLAQPLGNLARYPQGFQPLSDCF